MKRCPNRHSSRRASRHHNSMLGNVDLVGGKWFGNLVDRYDLIQTGKALRGWEHEMHFINGLILKLRKQAERRLYSGEIRGSRTARIRKIIKNIDYWLKQVVDWDFINPTPKLDTFSNEETDEMGNPFRRYVLATKPSTMFVIPVGDGCIREFRTQSCGGLIIDVNARLDNVPWFKGFLGRLSKKYPFLKKYCKFETSPTFVVQMKFWLDEHTRFVYDVARVPVHECTQTVKPIHTKEENDDRIPGEKARIYRFTGPFFAG